MSIKQAIEALESCAPGDYSTGHVIHPSYDEEKVNAALAALRSMPAEPVARLEIGKTKGGVSLTHIPEPAAFQLPEGMHALYTHQAPAQQPLTDEQIQDLLGIGNPTEEECRLIRLGWNAAHGIGGEK